MYETIVINELIHKEISPWHIRKYKTFRVKIIVL